MDLIDTCKRVIKRTPIYFTQFKTLLRKDGVVNTFERGFKKMLRFVRSRGDSRKLLDISYPSWIENVESKYLNEESMRKDLKNLKYKPKFSIIFPVWNKSREMLEEALNSIVGQIYDNWEICISDGSTENVKSTREFLLEFRDRYPSRVKFSTIDVKGINIIENSNNALSMATGEYVVFMDCDDEISPNCLLELLKQILPLRNF